MDKLRGWLEGRDMSYESFARDLNVSLQAVYKWMAGERLPGKENMNAIFQLTKGEVTPNDFILTDLNERVKLHHIYSRGEGE